MKLRFLPLVVLFLLSHAQADSSLKIGFIGSFSGPAQIYGDAAKNGLEMGLKELEAKNIEVLYEDDEFKPTKTVAAFRKLADVNGIDVAISVGSGPSSAVAPLAEQKSIPLIAWASDRRVSRGRKYVIRSYPSGFDEGKRVAEEALRRGYARMAVLISQNDYAESWKSGLIETIPSEKLIFQDELVDEVHDFKPLLLKARSKKVKELLICLNPGQSGLIAKQSKQMGGLFEIGGCEYLHDRNENTISDNALVGAWFATIAIQEGFRKRYLKEFGNESVLSGAANHYDLARVLVEALAGDPTKPFIERMMTLPPQSGGVGTFRITESGGDQFFDIPLVVKEITEDGFQLVDEANTQKDS